MRRLPLVTAIVALLAAPTLHAVTVFNFQNFNDCSTLQLNGDALCTSGALRLTSALEFQSASAFSQSIVTLGAGSSFSTFFAFRITGSGGLGDGDGPGADGLTFAIQPNSNTAGGAGAGIGYGGIPNSIAIEFDTFENFELPSDTNGNHIGIDQNGSVDSLQVVEIATRLNDGMTKYAWIDYNGTTLEVRFSQTNSRPAAPVLSRQIDLDTIVGGTQAFIGFTSATGSGFGNHDILQWRLESEFNPISGPPSVPPQPVPASSPFGLMLGALSLALLGLWRIRR